MLRPTSGTAAARSCRRHCRHTHSTRSNTTEQTHHMANIPRAAWRTGRTTHPTHRPRVGALYGNMHSDYATTHRSRTSVPRLVPLNTTLHQVLSQPHPARRPRFNPWTLLLELLDDPRIRFTMDHRFRRSMLTAAGHLGWVTPANIMAQRPLVARYLLRSECLAVEARYVDQRLPADVIPVELAAQRYAAVDLSPAQLTRLCQVLWPGHIAAKYSQRARQADPVDSSRTWLCAHLSILENTKDCVKHRSLFGRRLTVAQQTTRLIRRSYDHAPGLILNAIMSCNSDLSDILSPRDIHHIATRYFADKDSARSTVAQAWTLYDRLVYCNPRVPVPRCLDSDVPLSTGRFRSEQHVRDSPAEFLYRSLRSYDSWHEATQALELLYRAWDAGTPPRPSDQLLTDCYIALRAAQSPFRHAL